MLHPLRSASCGAGVQARTRVCAKEQNLSPAILDRESRPCRATKECQTCKKCPADGIFEHENCTARGRPLFSRTVSLEQCKKECKSKELCKGFVFYGKKKCRLKKTMRKILCRRPGITAYSKCSDGELAGNLTNWSAWTKPRFGIGILRESYSE